MPAGLHSASFIALFSSDLCSLVLSDLILFSTSCSTEASLLKLCDFGKCYTSRVLLLQVHRSRAEHNAGGKILDCKRDTKVHLPAITCTIPVSCLTSSLSHVVTLHSGNCYRKAVVQLTLGRKLLWGEVDSMVTFYTQTQELQLICMLGNIHFWILAYFTNKSAF